MSTTLIPQQMQASAKASGCDAHNNPFVCRNEPFVCHIGNSELPFVFNYRPFVGLSIFSCGFTLIELIITLVIVGILSALAVPSLESFVQSNRLTTATNDLITDMSLARSEAIKRKQFIGVCASNNATICVAGAWEGGWLMFADNDSNRAWSAGDTVLKVHDALPTNTGITGTANNEVIFKADGLLESGGGTLVICNSKVKKKRTITVYTTGRVSFTEGDC